MTNKNLTIKANKGKEKRQHSLLEDRYSEIFRIVGTEFQPHPLPDNISLEQPSPSKTVPSITTDTVLEDVTVTEIWEATPNA